MYQTSENPSNASLPTTPNDRQIRMRNKYRLYLAMFEPDPLFIPPPRGVRFDTVLLLVPKCPNVLQEETIRFEVAEASDDFSDNDSDVLGSTACLKSKGKSKGKQHLWELAVSKVKNRDGLLNAAAFLGKVSSRHAMDDIFLALKKVELSRCMFEWVRCQWYWLAIDALRDRNLIPILGTTSSRLLWEKLYSFTCKQKFNPNRPVPCVDNFGSPMIACEIGAFPECYVIKERVPNPKYTIQAACSNQYLHVGNHYEDEGEPQMFDGYQSEPEYSL